MAREPVARGNDGEEARPARDSGPDPEAPVLPSAGTMVGTDPDGLDGGGVASFADEGTDAGTPRPVSAVPGRGASGAPSLRP